MVNECITLRDYCNVQKKMFKLHKLQYFATYLAKSFLMQNNPKNSYSYKNGVSALIIISQL